MLYSGGRLTIDIVPSMMYTIYGQTYCTCTTIQHVHFSLYNQELNEPWSEQEGAYIMYTHHDWKGVWSQRAGGTQTVPAESQTCGNTHVVIHVVIHAVVHVVNM